MTAPHLVRSVGSALITTCGLSASVLSGVAIPVASAACPDVQVVYARGTGEAPGLGPTGQAFVDNLRTRVAPRSFDVYPVNYPASDDWATGLDGIRDAGAHVNSMAQSCPNTKMVLSGYSQGAAVMGFVTTDRVPDGVDPDGAQTARPRCGGPCFLGRPVRDAERSRHELPQPAAARDRPGISGQDHQGLCSRRPGVL